jgi:hypothetical protein
MMAVGQGKSLARSLSPQLGRDKLPYVFDIGRTHLQIAIGESSILLPNLVFRVEIMLNGG